MTPTPETIDVELVPLPAPLRLATTGFITGLKEVEARIATLKIVDQETAQEAADLLVRLTAAGKVLEETRVRLTQPVLEQQRKINALAKAPQDRIDRAKRALQIAATAYDNEQRRISEAAEAARKKELLRLQLIKLEEDKAARLKAQKLAEEAEAAAALRAEQNRPAPAIFMDFGEEEAPQKTETEKAIEAVQFAPAVVAPKPAGIAFRTVLVPTVTDVKALPDLFVTRVPNIAALRATFCNGYKEGEPLPECAGVRFEIIKSPVSTGR